MARMRMRNYRFHVYSGSGRQEAEPNQKSQGLKLVEAPLSFGLLAVSHCPRLLRDCRHRAEARGCFFVVRAPVLHAALIEPVLTWYHRGCQGSL